jgi:phosphotransferase system  glucose/maltose/N-acetylglucosamine-specific IIC component
VLSPIFSCTFVFFLTGVGFTASILSGQMILAAVINEGLRNSSMRGLFGNFNGIAEDDLTPQNGITLPATSSDRDIYYNFGLSCACLLIYSSLLLFHSALLHVCSGTVADQ